MDVRLARERDVPGFVALAAQVEDWFGPMVEDPGFHAAVAKHVRRGTALVATEGDDVLGGLFMGVSTRPTASTGSSFRSGCAGAALVAR
ncbi:hypothetical protein [Actinomadura algeriensis]|uniref:N-acetyltransferase domain-containing protein n=1 Tax=Actinomadura algeriensis TaxID=1679523 RepID=A0ABR9K5L1_9ACTN|nr:hypothetical protein [Actinomadura algeriensis]MBE1537914.1 hypothetical protein [Actinomadura algeriensis]